MATLRWGLAIAFVALVGCAQSHEREASTAEPCVPHLGEPVVLAEPGTWSVFDVETGPEGELWITATVIPPDSYDWTGYLLRVEPPGDVSARVRVTGDECVSEPGPIVLTPEGPVVLWQELLGCYPSFEAGPSVLFATAYDWESNVRAVPTGPMSFAGRLHGHSQPVDAIWARNRIVAAIRSVHCDTVVCRLELDASGQPIGGFTAVDYVGSFMHPEGARRPLLHSFPVVDGMRPGVSPRVSPRLAALPDGFALAPYIGGGAVGLVRIGPDLRETQPVTVDSGDEVLIEAMAAADDGTIDLAWSTAAGLDAKIGVVDVGHADRARVLQRTDEGAYRSIERVNGGLAAYFDPRGSRGGERDREIQIIGPSGELQHRLALTRRASAIVQADSVLWVVGSGEFLWLARAQCL